MLRLTHAKRFFTNNTDLVSDSRKPIRLFVIRIVILLTFIAAILFAVRSRSVISSAGIAQPEGPRVTAASGPLTLAVNTISDAADVNVSDGLCDTDAATAGEQCTLRAALQETNAAPTDDVINFNLPASSIIILNTALPDIMGNVTINGSGADLLTVQRSTATSTPNFRIFTINSSQNVAISGLTITNGKLTGLNDHAGGIFNIGTLTLTNCSVRGNEGGGIYTWGTLTLTNTTVSGNTTPRTMYNGIDGAGIANFGTLALTNSTVTGNISARDGGGIYSYHSGILTLTNSTVKGNTSAISGGGIRNFGRLTLTNSTVSGNTSGQAGGGGILNDNSTLTLTNSTVSGNTAGTLGGGIYVMFGGITLTNSTVSGNISRTSSGIYISSGAFLTKTLRNTIVAGNFGGTSPSTTANDISGMVDAASSFNLIGTGGSGGLINGVNNNQVGVSNPGLAALAYNGGPTMTHALLPVSPALDTGSNAFITNPPFSGPPFTDQSGSDRIVDGPDADATATVDIGAFEQQIQKDIVTSLVNNIGDAADVNVGDGHCDTDAGTAGDQCTLRGALQETNAAATDDTINFDLPAGSVITLNTALPEIQGNVTINGPGAALLTVQRSSAGGTPDFRIFKINSGKTVAIAGLTITNGKMTAPITEGGGIYNDGMLTLTNSTVSGSTADIGGGISNGDTLTLTNTTVSGNTAGTNPSPATRGGGISNGGTLTLTNSTVSGNTCGQSGGGIDNNGTLTVTNSTVSGNTSGASSSGGGTGGNGGGIANRNGGTLTLTNSTVSGNTSGRNGGGISNWFSLTLTNSTVSGNTALTTGGGISVEGFIVTLRNTIVAGNFAGAATSADIYGSVDASSSFNLIGPGGSGGLTNGANNNQVGVSDPGLAALAYNGGPTRTHALLPGSPAVDAGDNAFITNPPFSGPPFTDQRSLDRIVDRHHAIPTATVDIGAFEQQVITADIVTSTNEDTQLMVPFDPGDPSTITSVTATSDYPILVPNDSAHLSVAVTGSTGMVTVNPAANLAGMSIITVTVNRPGGSTSQTIALTVNSVNDPPSFTKGPDQTVNQNAGAQFTNWATNMSPGPANESGQKLTFQVTGNTNPSLFAVTLAMSSTGTLTYTSAKTNGSATITIVLKDDGGTANGGVDTSAAQTFTVTVGLPNAHTPSVTSATTYQNNQSTSGLVISRNAADGAEVTHFKITNIQNGALFKNDGTTRINNNDFIIFAEGNAGLKFTPATGLLSPATTFSFDVQASLNNTNAGLGGNTATATITVDCGPTLVTNSNDSGAGSLRAVINGACGGTITFDMTPGHVTSPISLTSGELVINKSLTINGPGANLLTVQRGSPTVPFRVFDVQVASPAVVTLSGLTIANGRSITPMHEAGDPPPPCCLIGNGAGILNLSTGTVNVTESTLSNNVASNGGGIFNYTTGSVNVTNCTFGNNSTDGDGFGGGGIFNYSTGAINVTNSTFKDNTSGGIQSSGGAIYNTGTIEVTNSTFSGNSAVRGIRETRGGAIYNGGVINVTNTTLSGNSAADGGGIYTSGTLTLTNSTVSGNTTYKWNTDFYTPPFNDTGGGIFNLSPGTVRLLNNIVALNTAKDGPDMFGAFITQGSNLIGKGDGSTGLINGVNNDKVGTVASRLDPLLGMLQNNGGPTETRALLPGSPAIDAGNNCVLDNTCLPALGFSLTTDQRGPGFARNINGAVDIGAFESRGFTIAATSGSSQSTPILSQFGSPLVATVTSAFSEPIAGGVVTLTAPATGMSGTFPGNVTIITATTNASGVATSPMFTANGTPGGPYNVVASIGAGLPSVNFALTNLKANQTIVFGALENKMFGDPDFSVSATSTSGLAVSFSASGPCTVSADTVHITGAGSCTITASQTGNSIFAPAADVAQSFTIADRALISFSQSNYDTSEGSGFVTITVNRGGLLSNPVTVDYATDDQWAPDSYDTVNRWSSARCDFGTSMGTLTFAPGETQKTFRVLINRDSYTEGPELFTINLSNLPANASLATPSTATATIADETAGMPPNTLDDPKMFVQTHYHDFLNREADPGGLDFWTKEVTSCGADAQCIEVKRINVSASFFLSIEFQDTGYLVERLYRAAYGNAMGTSTLGGPHQLAVPIIRLDEFLRDTQSISQGVIVNQPNWQQQLQNNKQTFIAEFMQRARFTAVYPGFMTAVQFVDTLNANAGNPLSPFERDRLVIDLLTNQKTRGQVLRAVAEDPELNSAEFNRAFVLMQYFAYLRRNPDDAQDTDYTGYDFWLTKLNQFNGNYHNAEMVKAFTASNEYRQRFGAW